LPHGDEPRIREADANQILCLVRRAQSDEPVRLAIRQRTKKDGVDDAEERDVRADAEPEAEDRDQRETWRLDQLTDCVTNRRHGGRPSQSVHQGDLTPMRTADGVGTATSGGSFATASALDDCHSRQAASFTPSTSMGSITGGEASRSGACAISAWAMGP